MQKYEPAKTIFVNQEGERMRDLLKQGGPKAVAAYKEVFKEVKDPESSSGEEIKERRL